MQIDVPTQSTRIPFGGIRGLLHLALLVTLSAETSEAQQADEDLAGLNWMAGHWVTLDGTHLSEEFWLSPLGGSMLGINRQQTGSGRVVFEYLRIETSPEGPVYVASPGGRPETKFLQKETGDRRVIFENLLHDFPKRIIYWLDSEERLHARIEGDSAGSPSQEWVWHRKAED